jgi:hypothetical protein
MATLPCLGILTFVSNSFEQKLCASSSILPDALLFARRLQYAFLRSGCIGGHQGLQLCGCACHAAAVQTRVTQLCCFLRNSQVFVTSPNEGAGMPAASPYRCDVKFYVARRSPLPLPAFDFVAAHTLQ